MSEQSITEQVMVIAKGPINDRGFSHFTIDDEDGRDVFVHIDDLCRAGYYPGTLQKGIGGIVDIGETEKGLRVFRFHELAGQAANYDRPLKRPQKPKPQRPEAGQKYRSGKSGRSGSSKGPKITRPRQLTLQVGDVVGAILDRFDNDRGFGFAVVKTIRDKKDGYRPLQEHEQVNDLFIHISNVAEGEEIEQAVELRQPLVIEVIESTRKPGSIQGRVIRVWTDAQIIDLETRRRAEIAERN